MLATTLVAGALVAVGTGVGQGCAGILDRAQPLPGRPTVGERPNIVFVLSDDQRFDTMWAMPNVLLTPHVGGSVRGTLRRAYALAGEQLRRYAAGDPLINVVTDEY